MSSFVRRSVAAAGTLVAASGATFALMLGTAGAAHADDWCSMSTACVKPTPEFNEAATDCIPPAAVGGAAGAATGGPGGAVVGGAAGAANCAYNKANP